jgi:hypothetical protein
VDRILDGNHISNGQNDEIFEEDPKGSLSKDAFNYSRRGFKTDRHEAATFQKTNLERDN